MSFYSENIMELNSVFGTEVPPFKKEYSNKDRSLISATCSYLFDIYPTKSELAEALDITVSDLICVNYANIDNQYVIFNECNYDYNTKLVIGDFDENEMSRLKDLHDDAFVLKDTNFTMLKNLLEVYKPKKSGVASGKEVALITHYLHLKQMDILQLRNLRDFTVMFLSFNSNVTDYMTNMDIMSAITCVIDNRLFNLGAEV